jgi:hypothetical protein
MPEESGEVRIKLVVDDLSKAIVEGVKASFGELNTQVEQTTKHVGHEGMAGEVFKGNLYFELMKKSVELVGEGIKEAFELTEKLADAAVEAAEAQEKQEKQMAGFLSLMDGGKHSMQELRSYTADMREEFEAFGLKAGIATKDLVDGFDQLVQRGTMSSEKAKELTEQMAIVGKVVPGGMSSLAEGMGQLEQGVARVRNPIVQLIAATHMLKGNAHAVAQQLQHMTPDHQIALGEKAIARQAEMIKKAGGMGAPSLGALKTSFEGVKESFLESMGKPMLDALIPHLVKVRDYLVEHIDAIKAFGEKVGYEVGHAIDFLTDITGGVYDAFHENWDEVKSIVDEITSGFQEMWGGATNNSHAIAHTFKDITVDVIHAFKWVADSLLAVSDTIKRVVQAAGEVLGMGDEIRKGKAEEAQGAASAAGRGIGPEADRIYAKQVENYVASARAAEVNEEEIRKNVDAMDAWHEQIKNQAGAVAEATAHNDFEATANYLQEAINTNNEGSLKYAISLLEGSEEAREAFAKGEVHIVGGFQALIGAVGELSPELAKKLKEAANVVKQQGGINAPGGMNFYGATFNLHQDLRGEDPDRVVLTFKRDIARAAASRLQSRMGGAFGI